MEHGEEIIFLHAVADGPANRSYGLQVAKLAGIPGSVLDRARERLLTLDTRPAQAPVSRQSELFQTSHPLQHYLDDITPDELTPKQALELLYLLKDKLLRK